MPERQYLCIDQKSFYATVECVARGLDPMTTNLVVADPTRSENTICLACPPDNMDSEDNEMENKEIPNGLEEKYDEFNLCYLLHFNKSPFTKRLSQRAYSASSSAVRDSIVGSLDLLFLFCFGFVSALMGGWDVSTVCLSASLRR